jgi:hypothetical protein
MRNRNVCHGHAAAVTIQLIILSLSCASTSYGQGGPPMLTDDPGTPGAGQWEINTAYLEERTADTRVRSFPHIDINYGWGEHIQLKYETGYLFTDGTGGGLKGNLDDSLLGFKWRFLDQERASVDVSVYPQLELQNSHRSVTRGAAEPDPNLFLPIEIGRAIGPVRLIAEVGYQYSRGQKNEWMAGILGALEVSKTLELLAEMRSISKTFLSGGDVIANVGFRQELGARVKLMASAGPLLRGGPDATHFIGYIGIQLSLGDKK